MVQHHLQRTPEILAPTAYGYHRNENITRVNLRCSIPIPSHGGKAILGFSPVEGDPNVIQRLSPALADLHGTGVALALVTLNVHHRFGNRLAQ